MVLCTLILSLVSYAHAQSLSIAAPSDLHYAMRDLLNKFSKKHPNQQTEIIFGSSGKLYTLIKNGAPFDIYFSADMNYPQMLVKEGLASGDVKRYGYGRLVFWHGPTVPVPFNIQDLLKNNIMHIAIANPKHAPYGRAAEEALKASGLWEKIKGKLVFGENVSQAAQLVNTQNAQVGLTALSLAMNPELLPFGKYTMIPVHLYRPLEQGFVITKRAEDNKTALAFAEFMMSPVAQLILREHGFSSEAPPKNELTQDEILNLTPENNALPSSN